jgi:hypothetical protein
LLPSRAKIGAIKGAPIRLFLKFGFGHGPFVPQIHKRVEDEP